MATTSTLPAPKRRKQVYGKLAKQSKWDVKSFFDDDDLASSDAIPANGSLASLHGEKHATKSAASAIPSRPAPRRHDTFDIPSSDDDQAASPAKALPPPKFQRKMALLGDTRSDDVQFAPWERKNMQVAQERTPRKARPTSNAASPEAQLKQDLMHAVSSAQALMKGSSPSPKGTKIPIAAQTFASQPSIPAAAPVQSSAMARLAARRQDPVPPNFKRSALSNDDTESDLRKRPRITSESSKGNSSSPKYQLAEQTSSRVSSPKSVSSGLDGAADVYDVPGSDEDEQSRQRLRTLISKPSASTTGKRGKPRTYTTRAAVRTDSSPPTRLADIIPDIDSTEAPTRSPPIPSRYSSPRVLPSTPPREADETRDIAPGETNTMTAKQSQLWHELLPSDVAAPSSSALPIKNLAISQRRRTDVSPFDRKLAKSYSTVPRRRTRLVDKLKASAPGEGATIADHADEADRTAPAEPSDANDQEATSRMERPTLLQRASSQRQMAAIAHGGPKITYAQSRSYLQEDSTEQDFVASLGNDPSEGISKKKHEGKGTVASQRSSFDLDDSEDGDDGAGRIRTIHELRAAGRSVSGMYDIEELLSEIQNHNPSHRGRRRSALVELATKLLDKTFATRFTAQSLEIELARECGMASDTISDFILAAALSLVLVSEPPQHTLHSFKEQNVLNWLTQLLDQTTEVSKLAKSRQSNMSKAAQASLVDFSHLLERQPSIWPAGRPMAMTSRVIALKALDQLVGKLRRLGDRSELLTGEHIMNILPVEMELLGSGEQAGLELAISVLESLSTSTASLSWPPSSLHCLAEMLPRLAPDSATQQHTVFLMLRLCLNLTNDNVQNCHLLSKTPAVVHHLLLGVTQAFSRLNTAEASEEAVRALTLDLLVLSMGIMINLTEQHDGARQHALQETDILSSLITTFQHGQQHMLEAESVEESVTNVAFGYLAVVLANVCYNAEARRFVADRLPGKDLGMLVEAVEEFVAHHVQVDMMNFEGAEGAEVWSVFTEKLKLVLVRLREGQE